MNETMNEGMYYKIAARCGVLKAILRLAAENGRLTDFELITFKKELEKELFLDDRDVLKEIKKYKSNNHGK
jgi:hypothetical protein